MHLSVYNQSTTESRIYTYAPWIASPTGVKFSNSNSARKRGICPCIVLELDGYHTDRLDYCAVDGEIPGKMAESLEGIYIKNWLSLAH